MRLTSRLPALRARGKSSTVTSESALNLSIDLKTGALEIRAIGDISLVSGGRISLDAAEGMDLRSGGNVHLTAQDENVIRGKVVRIN